MESVTFQVWAKLSLILIGIALGQASQELSTYADGGREYNLAQLIAGLVFIILPILTVFLLWCFYGLIFLFKS
jgi:hypothetical protein